MVSGVRVPDGSVQGLAFLQGLYLFVGRCCSGKSMRTAVVLDEGKDRNMESGIVVDADRSFGRIPASYS